MWRQSKSLARGVRRRARRHWKSLAYAALAAGAVVLAAWLVLYVLPPTLASDKTGASGFSGESGCGCAAPEAAGRAS